MNLVQSIVAAATFVVGSIIVVAATPANQANAAAATAAEQAKLELAKGIPVTVTNPVTTVGINTAANTVKLDAKNNSVRLDPASNVVRLDPNGNAVKLDANTTVKLDADATVKLDSATALKIDVSGSKITPFNTIQNFNVQGISGLATFTVPAGQTLVVESISGRVALPFSKQLVNIQMFSQPTAGIAAAALPASVLFAEPKPLAKSVFDGSVNFPQDVYTFNTATRAYVRGTVSLSVVTDSFELPTAVSWAVHGYLIPTP